MINLSLYNLIHGPEIWLVFAAAHAVVGTAVIFGLFIYDFRRKHNSRKEDKPDGRS